MDSWVRLRPGPVASDGTDELRGRLAATLRDGSRDVREHLAVARGLAPALPLPGRGRTVQLWEALATLGATDLQLARTVEPHLDALAILAQAASDGHEPPEPADATWGVFAAEGPGQRLVGSWDGERWELEGTKPWCSLAGLLDRALVTAWVDDDGRRLFAVDLTHPGVRTDTGQAWHARGLRDVVSTAVELVGVPAQPVGPAGWYLDRAGFSHGGIGVAAVWYGGAVGLARRLARPSPRGPDPLALLHLGRVDAALAQARAVLCEAAVEVDSGRASGTPGATLALRARTVVAGACEEVLAACEHGLGPGPQVREPEYAAGLADLRLYLRQHHAEWDVAALGRLVVDAGEQW